MIGRRVASFSEVTEPGDYYGPMKEEGADYEICFFLLPIARDAGVDPGARSIHSVHFPPHTYRECPDGSLEIRASIGSKGWEQDGYIWHGFLDEGHVWRSC